MADFQQFHTTTHPIVELEDDWNNLLDHGLVKAASYIVRKNGSYYEAINGETGLISYGGEDNAGGATGTVATDVWQACVDVLTGGGLILGKENTTFPITSIVLDDDVSIAGLGWNTVFSTTSALPAFRGGIFNWGAGGAYTSGGVNRATLSNFKILGDGTDKQCGIILGGSDDCRISNVYCEGLGETQVTGAFNTDHDGLGIGIEDDCYRNTVENCYVKDCGTTGFQIGKSADTADWAMYNTLLNCHAEGNGIGGGYGFHLVHGAKFNNVIGGSAVSNTPTGEGFAVLLESIGGTNPDIIGNTIKDMKLITNGANVTAFGNGGLALMRVAGDCDQNHITKCHFDYNGAAAVGHNLWIGANCDENYVIGNITIRKQNADYAVEGTGNTVKHNTILSIWHDGTDTKFHVLPIQFTAGGDVDGTARWNEFTPTTASPKGWKVDDAADFATALGQLPPELQHIVCFKIWAVALGAPVGSPGEMRVSINMNAGAKNLAYTTEPVALAAFNGEDTDYVANDVVHWLVDSTDDADIASMVGGMSLELEVVYNAAVGDDGATNAVFRNVEIHYV